MNSRDVARHALVLLAVVSGIIGMGTVYQGISAGSMRLTSQGIPFLLVGLWWAGRELGRSITAGQRRK
jgi:hypothetical protein